MSTPSDPFPPEDPTIAMTPPSSGGSILPAGPLALREVIGDFEVLGRLGQGGMGAVYRARQVSLDRMVALKVLPAQFIEDAMSVARFQREARVAAGLSHASLVHVYASGEADGCHFIAMELIEGEDLGRRLKRDGALPAPEALRISLAVAEGLQHGWQSAHLIHRDIKPANIFLAADGAVKLGDLGLAKSLLGNSTGLTQSGTMMGTPHYISPEQARGDRELDFRADIYSLGCTLFQMLTGQVPYGGTDAIAIIRQHLDAPLPAILKVWPQCPLPLARLVGKMLKKARHERPASYQELIAQMKSVWAQIDPVGFEPESFAPPVRRVASAAEERPPSVPLPPPPARSRLPLYGGLAAGVALLAVVAWLAWPKPEKLTQAQLVMAQRAAAKIATPATPATSVMPEGASLFGGHGYQLVSEQNLTWTEAKVRAEKMGGHLATFTTSTEEEWVRDHLVAPLGNAKLLYWIGGFAEEHSRDFRWVTGEPFGKLRWAEGHPSWREDTASEGAEVTGILFAAGFAVGRIENNRNWLRVQPVSYQLPGFLVEWDDAKATIPQPAAGYPPPREWTDRTDKIRSYGLKTGELVADGEWLTVPSGEKWHHTEWLNGESFRDIAIRLVYANQLSVSVEQGNDTSCSVELREGAKIWVYLNHYKAGHQDYLEKGIDLGATYAVADSHEMVFTVQNGMGNLWVDGKMVARVPNVRVGGLAINMPPNCRIKKVETGELETAGTSPPAAPK